MTDQTTIVELLRRADLLPPVAIRTAATLRLADHITAGADTAPALAECTGTHPPTLAKLLAYLETIDLVTRDEAGRYQVTEQGALLRDGGAGALRRQLDMDSIFGRSELALIGLAHTVRTGEVAYPAVFGREYWQDVNELPQFVESLEQDTLAEPGWDAELVIKGYDWSGVHHVFDVGGNNGTMLVALLREYPHLRGTLVDLTNMASIAERRFGAAGLADRAQAVVGSFFDPLPTGGDVYLLSAILADWNDAQAVAILRRCGQAAGPHGKVLVADVNLDFGQLDPPSRAAADLRVIATVARPVRTVEQIARLGEAAGLRLTWRGPATAFRSVLEFATPGQPRPGQPQPGRPASESEEAAPCSSLTD